MALAGQRSAWYPWALLIGGALVSVTANAIHAVVVADADVPGILAASVAAVPPVVLLAITHLTVILTRAPVPEANAPDVRTLSVATAAEPDQTTPFSDAGGLLDLASVTVAAASVDPMDRRALGWELREEGWSNKRIARELGVHPSTVGRWFAPAHLSTDITESADQREETTP